MKSFFLIKMRFMFVKMLLYVAYCNTVTSNSVFLQKQIKVVLSEVSKIKIDEMFRSTHTFLGPNLKTLF